MSTEILFIKVDIYWIITSSIIVALVAIAILYIYIKRLKQTIEDAKSKSLEYKELLTDSATVNKDLLEENGNLKQKSNYLISKLNREINSSVNGIMGMANLLKETILNKEQAKQTNTIIDCSESLLQNARNIFNSNNNQANPNVMNNYSEKKVKQNIAVDFANEFPLRILVAEDDHINQILATKMLGKLGFKPDIVSNGKEALEIVSEKTYDVILMDGLMPEMDGFEATRMIRLCLEAQPVIIALTASTMYGDREKCLQAGMDDYISKPIDINELAGTLQKWAHERKVIVA